LGAFRALALEINTTWIDKSEFDGKTWHYAYVARGNKDNLSERLVRRCIPGQSPIGGKKILASVEFRIVIVGDFSDPNGHSVHEGSVNVREAIEACLTEVGADRNVNAPVALVFPPVTAPSDPAASIGAYEETKTGSQ
jgi:hypothetical protein